MPSAIVLFLTPFDFEEFLGVSIDYSLMIVPEERFAVFLSADGDAVDIGFKLAFVDGHSLAFGFRA